MKFIVIGITDNPQPFFPPEVLTIIREGNVFSGGRRHHDIVASLLPATAQWIDITVPLDAVFRQYETVDRKSPNGQPIVVFASGDPLFYGFANTLRCRYLDADIVLYPSFNSLQMLAHRLTMPYHNLRIVSLTGRPWTEFDRALIEEAEKMGVLTDREHTPAAIARRMMEYGYDEYKMFVGERLGNPQHERVVSLTLEEAAQQQFAMPNCVILVQNTKSDMPSLGIPDAHFALLDGRERMITKMPIRLLTLQALELKNRSVLWDIGFCTGSVSIEARRLFPQLSVVAFEVRPECEAIMLKNMRRFGVPGIDIRMGDFLTTDCDSLPRPDAVFIGGHGGRLKEIMAKVSRYLSPVGIIVMNSVRAPRVTTDSQQLFTEACTELGLWQDDPMRVQINDYHPITILKCRT